MNQEEQSLTVRFSRVLIPLAILGVGVGGLILIILLNRSGAPAVEAEEPEAPLVETVVVQAHDEGLDIRVDGLVVPHREITLAAEVPGRVIRKADVCQAGNYVSKGTLLIEIDPRDYELEVRRLEKELDQAEANLRELDVEEANTKKLVELAEESFGLQQNELARIQKLAEKAFVTDSQMDQEKRNVLTARNALLLLRNQLRTLKTRRGRLESARDLVTVRLERARLDLARTKITSPIDGMIVRDSVESDAYLSKGTTLLTIEDVSSVEVRCQLRVDQLYWVWSQVARDDTAPRERRPNADYQLHATPVTVVYSLAGREYLWDGVLSRYDGIGLDESTRTVPCTVLVDAPGEGRAADTNGSPGERSGPPALVRGMYVKLKIHTRPKATLLRTEEKAVRPGHKVWRVRSGVLNIVDVHVVGISGDVAILRGSGETLVAGDRVVVTPRAAVQDGMAVREEGK